MRNEFRNTYLLRSYVSLKMCDMELILLMKSTPYAYLRYLHLRVGIEYDVMSQGNVIVLGETT